jgi:hypothetical protein
MNRRQIPYLVIALTLLTALVVLLEAPAAIRIPIMLGFLFLAPGMAFVPLLRLPQKGYEFTLGVALSLLLEALTAAVMVELRVWSVELNLEILGSLTLIGCALQIYWPAAPEEPEHLEPDADGLGWGAS